MGLLERVRRGAQAFMQTGMRSRWTPSGPEPLTGLLADLLALELDNLPMGRQAGMRIPGAARPRNLLIGMCQGLPLRAMQDGEPIANQPAWMSRTDGMMPVQSRLAWTLDDGYWFGNSLWAVKRAGSDATDPILDGDRVVRERWHIDPTTMAVYVDGIEARAEEYMYFDWPFEGMLEVAHNTLDGARAIEKTWVARAKAPAPMGVLKHTPNADVGAQLKTGEPEALLAQWGGLRTGAEGTAWGYLPPELEVQLLSVSEQVTILEGARNAVRTDFANHSNFPVSVIDGAVTQQSLTYRNAQGDVSRVYLESFPFYLDPITARLSMDDVLPAGQSAAFDQSKFDTPAPPATGVPLED